MQEGSLRCDANVNLHIMKDGRKIATPIVEVKNLNSFRAVEKALHYEADRQYRKWQEDGLRSMMHPRPPAAGTTLTWSQRRSARRSQWLVSYRYFPEPTCFRSRSTPPGLTAFAVQSVNCPGALRRRFESEYGLSSYDANVLVEQGHDVAVYFDGVAHATGELKLASNWIQQDVLRTIKEQKLSVAEFPVGPTESMACSSR